jgi:DNA modification methylase
MEETKKLELNKVYCMDAIEYLRKFKDNSINLILTDPPYNILKFDDIKTSNTILKRNVKFDQLNVDIPQLMMEIERVLVDGGTFIIFCADRQLGDYIDYCKSSISLKYSNTLVWVNRLGHPNVRKRSFSNHTQYIAFGHKEIEEKYIFNWQGEKKMLNVLNYNGCTSFEYGKARHGRLGEWVGHPTQKPTKLIRHLIKICSEEGQLVIDPYCGSGTTLLCSKQLNRIFGGCDIEEKWVDVTNKRLNQSVLTSFPPTSKGEFNEKELKALQNDNNKRV